MTLPDPTPLEHEHLMFDPEARDERRTARLLAARALSPIRTDMGRTRPDLWSEDQLPLYETTALDESVIINLGKTLQEDDGHPILDQFTRHYLVNPTRDNLERYVTAANAKMKVTPDEDPKAVRARKQRQTQHIADQLQQGAHDDLNIARLRRASLRTTRYLIATGKPLDKTAARYAAEAVQDFGHGLNANRELLRKVHNEGLGEVIAYLGGKAATEPGILRQNPILLHLVQNEQKARVEFWTPVFFASKRIHGPRLTKQHKQDDFRVKDELARLEALCHS